MTITSKRTPQHTHHDKMRQRPARTILIAQLAAEEAGLRDIELEWPTQGYPDERNNTLHWFDISGITGVCQRVVLDMEPGYWDSRPTAAEKKRYAAKQRIAKDNNWIFYTIRRDATKTDIRIELYETLHK